MTRTTEIEKIAESEAEKHFRAFQCTNTTDCLPMVLYDKQTHEYQFLNLSSTDDEAFLHQIEEVAKDETIAVMSYPHFKVVQNKALMLGETAAIEQMKKYFVTDLRYRIKEVEFLKEKSKYINEQEEMKNGFSFCFARKEYTYPSIIQHLFTTKLNLV